MVGIYDADGKIRTTTVTGTILTGIYAADGSVNIVLDDSSHTGVYHPCGAFRVNSSNGTTTYDPSGAYYYNSIFGLTGKSYSPPVSSYVPTYYILGF